MADKKTCFVMMPFRAPYNSRYKGAYKPGIEAAGLSAYRVDEDRTAREPVVSIHKAIEKAHVCFADISLDIPNVWYELGYAYALKKEVVLVCEKSRKSFPFDLGHKRRIPYSHHTPDYLAKLKSEIEKEVHKVDELATKKAAAATATTTTSQSQDNAGKQLPEGWDKTDIEVLKAVASYYENHRIPIPFREGSMNPKGPALMSIVGNTMRLDDSIRKLDRQGLIARMHGGNYDGKFRQYDGFKITSAGWNFALKNKHWFD